MLTASTGVLTCRLSAAAATSLRGLSDDSCFLPFLELILAGSLTTNCHLSVFSLLLSQGPTKGSLRNLNLPCLSQDATADRTPVQRGWEHVTFPVPCTYTISHITPPS